MRNIMGFGGIDPSTEEQNKKNSELVRATKAEQQISPVNSFVEGTTEVSLSDLDDLSDLFFTDEFKFSVFFKPLLKLVEVDYSDWITAKILDFPPTPPVVHFWPLKDVATRYNISLAPSSGEIRQVPIPLRTVESQMFRDILNQQKSSDGKITFRYEGEIAQYEMFRIENAPLNWKAFIQDPTSITKIFAGYENFLFQETIQSNKDYYYTFRAYDFHLKFSNPSPIYKVRIYENDGVEYLDVQVYNFPVKKKITSKSFKKFIRIDTALEQQTYKEPNAGAPGKLGLYEESPYNQKYVLRITSKHTGKILDVVLNFVKEDII